MGRYVFKLPDVGEGTAEAEIVAWHVKVGDRISEDQHLVDVMTDKATVEMTSPVTGVVLSLHGEPGSMAPVGAPLVELEVEGEGNVKAGSRPQGKARDMRPENKAAGPVATQTSVAKTSERKETAAVAPLENADIVREKVRAEGSRESHLPRIPGARPLASPAVRQRARDLGIELQFVHGSGPAGRVLHADLDAWLAGRGTGMPTTSAAYKRDGVQEIKLIGLRRRIAENMQEAKRRIPHFAYVDEIDMTELEALRDHMNATKAPEQPKLNVLPFLMRALVKILPAFPQINARFDDEAGVVHRHEPVHIGIATQTPNGLMVPVVRHAEALDLWSSAREVARVAALARDGKAGREDISGSTITITSLGALGGVVTTPVINRPEVAIIGPNAILERPVVRNGQIVVRKMMNLSSSFDHRVVDGYDAAQFIQRVKSILEHPALLFMESP